MRIPRILLQVATLSSLAAPAAWTATSDPLVQPTDLQYVGAFRLPAGTFGASVFDYGGTAIAYNPAHNSLFAVGHPYDQAIAEVAIPGTIVNSTNQNSLTVATVLQPFSSVLPRIPNDPVSGLPGGHGAVGGLMVMNGQLIGTVFNTYDATGAAIQSHFKFDSLTLASAHVTGLFQVGSLGGGFVGGYMTPVPASWQSLLGAPCLTGQAALNIISRTSYGPSAFGFDPAQLGGSAAPDLPYVYYPQAHPTLGDYGSNPPALFNGTVGGDNITGLNAVFVPGSRSVLFFGAIGTGAFYYGEAADANDSNRTSKGPHSVGGTYVFKVWAYDAVDFVAVKNGQKNPWEVMPYATWNLSFPQPDGSKIIGGAAFDPATMRLYLSEVNTDNTDQYSPKALIQVMHVAIGAPGNQSPTVSLTGPADGTIFTAPAAMTLSANASDSDGSIAKVEFYSGSTLLGTDTTAPYSFAWSSVAVGTYALSAKAYDNQGAVTTSATVTITVGAIGVNKAPTVSLTGPANGASFTAPATITLSANAADSDGSIAKVEFYRGSTLLGTDTTAPYGFAWNSVAAGTYALSAKAYDNQGAVTTSATATITVNAAAGNQAPTVAIAASASPKAVTGTTTALSVLGADDGGEANLTYTWAATGTPPAPVSFSANGTNAAKAATATFAKAGSYSFTVTIKDQGGLTATSSVAVTVSRTPTSIALSPTGATVTPGSSLTLLATVKDQFQDAISPAPTLSWSASGGGTVSGAGVFTAGAATGGPFTIAATSGSVNGSTQVMVLNADGTGAITVGKCGVGTGGAAVLLGLLGLLRPARRARSQ